MYEMTVETTYSSCIGKKEEKAFTDNNGFHLGHPEVSIT